MHKRRLQISTAIFLLLTLMKMIFPASAVRMKQELQPILDHNDDIRQVLHRVGRAMRPVKYDASPPYVPYLPLSELQETLEELSENPASRFLPIASEPVQNNSSEQNPALEFGYAAREAFLENQSLLTDAAPPDNVSYDVLLLPFQESTPIVGDTSSGFGYRLHPIQNEMRFHYGTDYAADYGTEIHAFADGTVLEAGSDLGYGNYIKLDHGDGFVSLYGHCSELLVSEGDTVSRSQPIALVGSTGQSTGPHLHFELMLNGVYLNPEFYLYA